MTEILNYADTPAGALIEALGQYQPITEEAEHDSARREWEARYGSTEFEYAGFGGVPVKGTINERKRAHGRLATELRQRGNWIGAPHDCPECSHERAVDTVIERFDHTCYRSDMRIQDALNNRVKLQRAEHDGSIRGLPGTQPFLPRAY